MNVGDLFGTSMLCGFRPNILMCIGKIQCLVRVYLKMHMRHFNMLFKQRKLIRNYENFSSQIWSLSHSTKSWFAKIRTTLFHVYNNIDYRILNPENCFVVQNCRSNKNFGINYSISIIHSRLKLYNFVKISLVSNLEQMLKHVTVVSPEVDLMFWKFVFLAFIQKQSY